MPLTAKETSSRGRKGRAANLSLAAAATVAAAAVPGPRGATRSSSPSRTPSSSTDPSRRARGCGQPPPRPGPGRGVRPGVQGDNPAAAACATSPCDSPRLGIASPGRTRCLSRRARCRTTRAPAARRAQHRRHDGGQQALHVRPGVHARDRTTVRPARQPPSGAAAPTTSILLIDDDDDDDDERDAEAADRPLDPDCGAGGASSLQPGLVALRPRRPVESSRVAAAGCLRRVRPRPSSSAAPCRVVAFASVARGVAWGSRRRSGARAGGRALTPLGALSRVSAVSARSGSTTSSSPRRVGGRGEGPSHGFSTALRNVP